MINGLLLDTHIFLWLMEGEEKLSKEALQKILKVADEEGKIYLSAISVWEIGMLAIKKRIILKKPLLQWIKEALQAPHISLIPLSPEISIESCNLPDNFHADPADRIIVASARILSIPLITKDTRILGYAKEGHLNVITG